MKINVAFSNGVTVNIIDSPGQVIYTGELGANASELEINTEDLEKGLYFVQLSNADTNTIQKLIKK